MGGASSEMNPLVTGCALLALLLALPGSASAQKALDFDAEIKRKKNELARVAKQRAKVQKAIKQDKKDFDAYQARTKTRMDNIRSQSRDIRTEIGKLRKKYASLGATIGRYNRATRGYQLRQKNLSKRLIQHCDTLLSLARTLPPMMSAKAAAVLDYLKSELKGGSVDNIEGLHRLVRIARKLDAQLMEIQVSQGSSPVPQITGTCYRLRVGGVFEAVVKGEHAAVWDFGERAWVMLDDPKKAKLLLHAIEVRNGKQQPALVRIPNMVGARSPARTTQDPAPGEADPAAADSKAGKP